MKELLQVCRPVDNLRSGNFGSPNHRARVYIIGVHDDLMSDEKFYAMCDWIEKSCPECHDVSSLSDCLLSLQKESSGSVCSVWLGPFCVSTKAVRQEEILSRAC